MRQVFRQGVAMVSFFKKKKEVKEVSCRCGHDVMLHGFSNMGCSVTITGEDGNNKKCPCQKFEKSG
jgi:hypothetical protein